MKRVIAVLTVFALSIGLSACNTFAGMGKDVERGGEKVQDAANGARK
jgi:entericidin B